MKKEIELVLNDRKLVVSSLFLRASKSVNLSLNEFFILLYFENSNVKTMDLNMIKEITGLSELEILEAFNSLLTKNLITLETTTDSDNRLLEVISLSNFYKNMESIISTQNKEESVSEIFSNFETEIGRPISPMEYEIINAWITHGTSEELIIGALREAVFNGVKSFRYIDKIIYDWNNKGFKTMEDVKKHLNERKSSKSTNTELFDYNWLEDKE